MRRAWIWLCVFLLAVPLSAQTKKIGILPFEDATGAGPELGQQVAMFIRAEMLKSKKIMPKFITYAPAEGEEGEAPSLVDVEKALALGRDNEVDLVLIGTILAAEAESSDSSIGGISFKKATVGSSLRKVKATITIQGDLLSVAEGGLVESFEATGSKTDKMVGADLSTNWGDFSSGSDKANSPNAKALREAVAKLVKKILKKI
jgi:hypothetical protein